MINLIILALVALMAIGLLVFAAFALAYVESIYRAKDDYEDND